MSYYARVNIDGIVEQVIVAELNFINTLPDAGRWVETCLDTYGGQHPAGRPLRKNYAGIGYTYDKVRDAFIPPQEFPSWTLNEDTCLWEPPIPFPQDGKHYVWDEDSTSWLEAAE